MSGLVLPGGMAPPPTPYGRAALSSAPPPDNLPMRLYNRDAGDVGDFAVDLGGFLAAGDVIASFTIAIQPAYAGGLALARAAGLSGTVLTLWLSGGLPGIDHELTVTLETGGGRTVTVGLLSYCRQAFVPTPVAASTGAPLPAPVLVPADMIVPAVVADGVADNWAAIQAALNTGRHVLLPAGPILVMQTLRMTAPGQMLCGYGPATLLLAGFAAGDVIQVGAAGGVALLDVQLRDFRIWTTAPRTAGAAIHAISCGHLRVRGVWIGSYEDASVGRWLADGVVLQDTGDVTIDGGGALGCSGNGILAFAAVAAAEIQIGADVQMASNGCCIRIAGGIGGVYVRGNIQLSDHGVLCTVGEAGYSTAPNREILLMSPIIDSCTYEGFWAQYGAVAGCIVGVGVWCGGTKTPGHAAFQVDAGNASTSITGMWCNGNAWKGAIFAGGPTTLANFHGDQNGAAAVTIRASCGAIYGTIHATASATEHGIEFDAGYIYQVGITGGTVLPNAVPGIGNAPGGQYQIISGVVGYPPPVPTIRDDAGLNLADDFGAHLLAA